MNRRIPVAAALLCALSLGVAAPAYVPPGQAVAGPVVTFPAPPK